MTGLLASVKSIDEARIAFAGGADIIDLKNPAAGALGGLPLDVITAIVRWIDGRLPLSATIGDIAMQPGRIQAAVEAVAARGVDYVKIGLFEGARRECLSALRKHAGNTRLIAVLFADLGVDTDLVAEAARCGFAGVMLDTADKKSGGLREHLCDEELASFVGTARSRGLLAGLAGKLAVSDIPFLLAATPDYLGFRSALCGRMDRRGELSQEAIAAVSKALKAPAHGSFSPQRRGSDPLGNPPFPVYTRSPHASSADRPPETSVCPDSSAP